MCPGQTETHVPEQSSILPCMADELPKVVPHLAWVEAAQKMRLTSSWRRCCTKHCHIRRQQAVVAGAPAIHAVCRAEAMAWHYF